MNLDLREVIANVDREVIEAGTQSSCTKCPVALALKALLCNGCVIDVGSVSVGIFHHNVNNIPFYTTQLPLEAIRFIKDYDTSKRPRDRWDIAFKFKLEIPVVFLKEFAA